MNVLKSLSKHGDGPEQSKTGRRSFIWKVGAAVSAGLATAAPGTASSRNSQGSDPNSEVDRLSKRLEILEDENSIRSLNQAYETGLDNGRYEEIVELFAEDAEVLFNGGVFKGKAKGVSRLYCDRFRSGLTGKRLGPAPVDTVGSEQKLEIIEVAADRQSARAQFPYSIQVGTPMAPDTQLVNMARLHGEGILKWCEEGIYEASYVRDVMNEGWKIHRLEYRVSAQTDYRPGKSYARQISVPRFAKMYPEDLSGPDRLIIPA